jgi:UDP-N-acetylglucosamine--N-acetylmuramyl-(pentapeptide) pyrophosphoryl-undecaprenol N-acetylglucosamine transferase
MGNRDGAFILAGGGTGGHVFPAIAVARELGRRGLGPIVFVGTRRGIEADLVPREGFELELLSAEGFAGKSAGRQAAAIGAFARSLFQAHRLLARRGARVVLGVGGYASAPVVLAAHALAIPSVVQEQNVIPGIANRISGRFAEAVAVGFPGTAARFPGRAVFTGNPVRQEFFRIPARPEGSRPARVFLFGGSQGARALNRALAGAAPKLSEAQVEIVAQSGHRELETLRRSVEAFPTVRVEAFFAEIWREMERADLIVCRAGALTISELAAAGRPSILVPLATATASHQTQNARELEAAGAAVVLEESHLTGESLAREILRLLAARERLVSMAAAARRQAAPDAAAKIANLMIEVSRQAA